MLEQLYKIFFAVVRSGRPEKMRSQLVKISSAMSREDTTRVGTDPSWRSIRGPCLFERFRRER